jgi:hypothetical protein
LFLFGKLGEIEVVEAVDFGTNQQKKLRRSEHPTRRDAPLGRDDDLAVSTERGIPTECRFRRCSPIFYREVIPTGLARERQFELKIGVAKCTPSDFTLSFSGKLCLILPQKIGS